MNPARSRLLLSTASKTFLMGEYAVLDGAPALVMAHGPRFKMTVDYDGGGSCEGIHPQSPAGRWLRGHADKFSKVSVRFSDPHAGRGGFGASSAQFALVYAFSQMKADEWSQWGSAVQPKAIWDAYRSLHENEPQLPSGGDVIAQILGGITSFQIMPWQATASPWPFQDLAVLLVPTGVKVATHEHLRERLPVSDQLLKLAFEGHQAFVDGNRALFLQALRAYGDELERLQLVTTTTRGLIAQVASLPDVLAVKGCGALGADVLAVTLHPQHLEGVKAQLLSQGLETVATTAQLQSGLRFEMEMSPYQQSPGGPWA
ncbi:MAG: hypothetical protein AB7N80_02520 [Bdellovibrionales bacterium]